MRKRWMAAMSAALVLALAVTPTVAYAGGGDESGADAWIEPAPTPEPGEPFTEDGNLVTRDLLYDEATNKQFITVQTKGGSTFYVVIDYDKPADEAGEQYEAYFLNLVDEADLLALLDGDEAPAACDCIGKCAPGAVNTACPLCAVNMTECVGKPPEPVEPEPTPEPQPEPEAKGGGLGSILLVAAVVLVGGGAGWYFKSYRPKQQTALDDEDLEDYDDAPPWDEDEPEAGEGDGE